MPDAAEEEKEGDAGRGAIMSAVEKMSNRLFGR
jgi:hypothetical protein